MNKLIRNISMIFMLCSCVALLVSCGSPKQEFREMPTLELSVMEVKKTDQQFYETFAATIRGKQDININSQVTGFITKVNVDEGSIVTKGEVLFVIDQVQYEEAVNVAKASVAVAEANIATAKLTAENKKSLGERNIISSYEVKLAENELGSMNAQLALAEAELISAEKSLSFTEITSPSDGIVGKITSRIGTYVNPLATEALTTVTEFSTMFAQFSITEKKLLSLTKDSSDGGVISNMPKVQMRLSNGDIYDELGTIETISGTIDQSTGSASVRASFSNEDGILRSGGTASVIVPYTVKDCLMIPQSATYEIQDKKFVYVVGQDSKVSAKEIDIYPLNDGKQYAVTEGLSVGDKIVIEGITSIKSGSTIKVKLDTK